MKRSFLALLFVFGCHHDAKPAGPGAGPAPGPGTSPGPGPAPSAQCGELAAGEAMTPDQCTCRGGRVNGSIGGGAQAHCAANETELGNVRVGIEGGWCCKGG
jgi:hypothetical protein